jgi:ribosomal protein L33
MEEEKSVKPIHTKYRLNTGRLHHMIYCGVCREFAQRVCIGDKYCRECGTKIDWSDDK